MIAIALLILFGFPAQAKGTLPLTIEVRQDIEVAPNPKPFESRGKLYLDSPKAKAFQLRKGQTFQMIETGQEGSCRIKVADKEYGLTSCPWLEGFRDHQTEFFKVLKIN